MTKLKGLIAAAFTPFRNGKIALDVVPAYAKYLKANGVAGVFVNGTTGESQSLSVNERIEHAQAWLDAAPPDLKVIVHVGGNALPDCREMARQAQENGAWAISAMAPSFFKPSLEELIDFSARIAATAPELPFYYYHMPSMTGACFRMIEYLREAGEKIPTLAGIKFTHEDLMDFGLCIAHADGKYDMVFGRDEILLCGVALGGKAAIGSTYNFAAPLHQKILESGAENIAEARSFQTRSMEIIAACIKANARGLPAIRALTEWRAGLELGPMRPPVSPLTAEALQVLRKEAAAIAGDLLSEAPETVKASDSGARAGARVSMNARS